MNSLKSAAILMLMLTVDIQIFKYWWFLPTSQHTHPLSLLTIFKTTLVSIICILELSVLHQGCLEFNFQANGVICRVPCTAVFLRSRIKDFQYLFRFFLLHNLEISLFNKLCLDWTYTPLKLLVLSTVAHISLVILQYTKLGT